MFRFLFVLFRGSVFCYANEGDPRNNTNKERKIHERTSNHVSLPFEPDRASKVEQQTDMQMCGLQIVQQLGHFPVRNSFAHFQLCNDLAVANQIRLIFLIKRLPLVKGRQPLLPFEGYLPALEFDFECLLVNRL
jgi:hypothetical protein